MRQETPEKKQVLLARLGFAQELKVKEELEEKQPTAVGVQAMNGSHETILAAAAKVVTAATYG